MAKRQIVRAAASVILEVFIRDSSSSTGAGLTGLVFNSAGLTCYYHRNTAAAAVQVSLVTMTVGTFTSSGFKEVDSANMPGVYQLCLPDAAFAVGAQSVSVILKGAANMMPVAVEIELSTFDVQTSMTQTGDSYARLGAPSGVSIAADIQTRSSHTAANVRAEMDANSTRLANLDATVSSRSAHSVADVWAAGTRTLTSFGTLVSDIWSAATRTLTAVSDSAGVTTLLARIASALTITGGKVDVSDKTGFALAASERVQLAASQPDYAPAVASDVQAGLTAQGYTTTRAGYLDVLNGLVAAVASAVWLAAARTLTAFAFTVDTNPNSTETAIKTKTDLITAGTVNIVSPVVDGSDITVTRGTTIVIPLEGLDSLTGRSALYFTVKKKLGDADADAVFQIKETGGLRVLNGVDVSAERSDEGSIEVAENETGITIRLEATAADELGLTGEPFHYDVKAMFDGEVEERVRGRLTVSGDVTRAIV